MYEYLAMNLAFFTQGKAKEIKFGYVKSILEDTNTIFKVDAVTTAVNSLFMVKDFPNLGRSSS